MPAPRDVQALEIVEKLFDELTPLELYRLLQLRSAVFVVEQASVFQDLDDRDLEARHLLGWQGGTLVAYARWYLTGEGVILGRILTALAARGRGFGRRIVREALERIGPRPVIIQAQAHLERFYEELGFRTCGPVYELDGIPHLPMRRVPGATAPRGDASATDLS